jgi:GYF domain 2
MTELPVSPRATSAAADGPSIHPTIAAAAGLAAAATALATGAPSSLAGTPQTATSPAAARHAAPSARPTSNEANEEVELQPTSVFKRQQPASVTLESGRWFVYQESGTHLGPVDVETLARGVATGKIPSDAHVARQGDAVWVLVDTLPAIHAAQAAAKDGAAISVPALVAVPKAPAPSPEAKPKLSPESTAAIFTAADLEAALELVDAEPTPVPNVRTPASASPPSPVVSAASRASRPPPPAKSLSSALRVQALERAPLTAPEPPTVRALNAESARMTAASSSAPGASTTGSLRPPSVRPISTKPAAAPPFVGGPQLAPPLDSVAPSVGVATQAGPPLFAASMQSPTLIGAPAYAASIAPNVDVASTNTRPLAPTVAADSTNGLDTAAGVEVGSMVTVQQFKVPAAIHGSPAIVMQPPVAALNPHESHSTLVMAPSSPPSGGSSAAAPFAPSVGHTLPISVPPAPAYGHVGSGATPAAAAVRPTQVSAPPAVLAAAAPQLPAWIPLVTFGVFAAVSLVIALVMTFTAK